MIHAHTQEPVAGPEGWFDRGLVPVRLPIWLEGLLLGVDWWTLHASQI